MKLSDGVKIDDIIKFFVIAVNGKVYGVFVVIELFVMYYNKDLIKEVLKIFVDLENFVKDSKYVFVGEDGKIFVFLVDWINFYYVYGFFVGNGVYVFG